MGIWTDVHHGKMLRSFLCLIAAGCRLIQAGCLDKACSTQRFTADVMVFILTQSDALFRQPNTQWTGLKTKLFFYERSAQGLHSKNAYAQEKKKLAIHVTRWQLPYHPIRSKQHMDKCQAVILIPLVYIHVGVTNESQRIQSMNTPRPR